jgi:CheY-like chemotaxis protein
LITVNAQLQGKIGELEATTNDLSNLLSRTNIAVVSRYAVSCASFQARTLPPRMVSFMHDLRNHLASIRAAGSLLRTATDKDRVAQQVSAGLAQHVDRMVALLDEFIGEEHAAQDSECPPLRGTPSAQLKVLIADDNADAATTLSVCLRLDGHDTQVSFDGQEIVRLATDAHPDVMILNINMPTGGGYDVARDVRSQDWGSQVRLIAVNGYFSAEDRERAAAAGLDAYLTKPIDIDRLHRLLTPPAN